MITTLRVVILSALALAGPMAGVALQFGPVRAEEGDPTELGEGKQEFEIGAQGGTYRFEYVAQGDDGYRTVFWRQSNPLSDDNKDAKLAESVVKSVFLNRFCKEVKKPVSLADGSPAPSGKIGIWTASLRCAEPPPKAKKEKSEKTAAEKPAKKVKDEIADETKPDKDAASGDGAETKPKRASTASGSSDAPAKSEKKPAAEEYDGPMTCTRTDEGFECRPAKG